MELSGRVAVGDEEVGDENLGVEWKWGRDVGWEQVGGVPPGVGSFHLPNPPASEGGGGEAQGAKARTPPRRHLSHQRYGGLAGGTGELTSATSTCTT